LVFAEIKRLIAPPAALPTAKNNCAGCAKGRGQIEVYCGSMFAGKTEALIRLIRLAKLAKQKVMVFKPKRDDRYDRDRIVSHDQNSLDSLAVERASEILGLVDAETTVVAIEEVQFFDAEIVKVCRELANRGLRVIVAGLDKDYADEPFPTTAGLMAIAEYVEKLTAVCTLCGAPAHFSHRKTPDRNLILVGGHESYEALCRKCYFEITNEKKPTM
jgi:thymidine kinase